MSAETRRPVTASRKRTLLPALGLRPADGLLPVALLVWATSVAAIDPSTMNDYGLLAALPVSFFIALGLLVVSIVMTLNDTRPSAARFVLHVIGLVVVLHATVPLILSTPNYPWTYKHIGVTDYINLHGSVTASTDIYQSWPGFFAVAAAFTKLAGVGSPLAYAAWAPVYFNLLSCLMLAFVFRALPVTRPTRWLAMFVFVAGNWVGQDYFAPQALAFVLTLAVLGMLLTWHQADRRPQPIIIASRLAHRVAGWRRTATDDVGAAPSEPSESVGHVRGRHRSRRELATLWIAAGGALVSSRSMGTILHRWQRSPRARVQMAALLAVFAAVVVTHQLSPYMIIITAAVLTAAGTIRPIWIVTVLAVIAVAYLAPHLPYLQRTQDIFGSLLHPFGNVGLENPGRVAPSTGHRIVSLGAPALVLGLWALAGLGLLRRLRAGRPALVVTLLAGAPVLLALAQSYGGEAVLRIYLFSLPGTALLAASALLPFGRATKRVAGAQVGVALACIIGLFMAAFYGSEGLYRVQPGALKASQYFYAHARPGSVLVVGASQFPGGSAGNYNEFQTRQTPNLLDDHALLHRHLGTRDVTAVSAFMARQANGRPAYLVLTSDQQEYAQVLGLLPKHALTSLGAALARDRDWRIFLENRDATIYQYLGNQPDGGNAKPSTDTQRSDTRTP